MSLIRFTLGGEAEIASSDDVKDAVDGGTDRILGRLNESRRHLGNRRRIPASVNIAPAATGTWVLDFGSPQGGDMWWIVEVVVTGVDDRTAPAAAVASLYSGPAARQVGNTVQDMPLLGNLIRPAIAIPGLFPFSKEAWPVPDGENLFAVVYSPTTTLTMVSGVATVMELNSRNAYLGRS